MLETAELDAFRQNATGPLAAELDAVLYSPAGVAVTTIRDDFDRNALATLRTTSLQKWLGASGARIASLRGLQASAQADLAAAASNDVGGARARGYRDVGISVVVLLLVA